uniref:Uncharacterized protein n=1 Tax=Avena sativa TaxID=4498 RepID=A0ACD5ZE64_AVESA
MRALLALDKLDDKDLLDIALKRFTRFVGGQMLRVNVLLMGNAILMVVMVGIGAYGHRYRHHPLTRFLFMGATILFLPIVSYIVSITGSQYNMAVASHLLGYGIIAAAECKPSIHTTLILLWTAFVQIVGINTTAIVVADDREGRSIAPAAVLLVQAVWTTYLGVNIMLGGVLLEHILLLPVVIPILSAFALIFAKIFFKYYAWFSARQSFSFRRNPRLVVGYMNMMEQLPPDDHRNISQSQQQHTLPPLIVSREDTMVIGKQPHGYGIMCSSTASSGSEGGIVDWSSTTNNKRGCLVTIDKVWQLDDTLLKSTTPHLKDVCFSFALFKMLRCRFARYNTVSSSEAAGFIKARDFLWNMLIEDSDGTRTLEVIASELSFLHDYYYTSLPISYSKDWLPILGVFISLLSIVYCLFGTKFVWKYVWDLGGRAQVGCVVGYAYTSTSHVVPYLNVDPVHVESGSLLFDVLPVLLLVALVVLSEVKEIASYLCSNWTKVALMCRYDSWREYPALGKCIIGLLLQCKCKLVRPWQDNMNQCSVIGSFHPKKFTPLAKKKGSVMVPKEVKAAIVNTLRSGSSSRGDDLRNGKMTRKQLGIQVGDNFVQARGAQGTSDTLLAWHIATTIFQSRNPSSLASASSSGSVATHLSRYCAYLVAYAPELLPDEPAWSNSLYKNTMEGAQRALHRAVPRATPEQEYRQHVELLSSAGSEYKVLKEGARLGKQLVELMKGEEEAAWKALAGFWCEMILHLAPSDNLDGHALAIARGGELITLLWALLTHLSVPEAAASTTTTTSSSSSHGMGVSADIV